MRNRARAQARSEHKKKKALLMAVFSMLFLYLSTSFLIGDMGYLSYRKLVVAKSYVKADIESIASKNRMLETEITALKEDPSHIEKLAREDLGLGREGELIFNFEK